MESGSILERERQLRPHVNAGGHKKKKERFLQRRELHAREEGPGAGKQSKEHGCKKSVAEVTKKNTTLSTGPGPGVATGGGKWARVDNAEGKGGLIRYGPTAREEESKRHGKKGSREEYLARHPCRA